MTEWPILLDEMVAFVEDDEGEWWLAAVVLNPGEPVPHIEVMPLPDVEDEDA